MSLVLIQPPTDDVITLDEAKAHLRVDLDDVKDDDLITALIGAAVGIIDPAAGGWLGRALRPQVWELRLPSFFNCDAPGDLIALKPPPLISVDSFVYDDAGGVEQTLIEGTDFRIVAQGSKGISYLAPMYGESWPSTRADREAVRIQFTAGYPVADGNSPDGLPLALKQACLLRIGAWYENREETAIGVTVDALPASVAADSLLTPYRIWA